MNKKTPRSRRPSSVVTMSFEPGCYVEFTDTESKTPAVHNHKHGKPRRAVRKNALAASDRQCLGDIEVWLNKCVNRAPGIETKRGARIVELLCDVRGQVQQLRG
jgi:hypothetical protein